MGLAEQYNYVTVLLQGKNGQSELRVKGNREGAGCAAAQVVWYFGGNESFWEEESGLFMVFIGCGYGCGGRSKSRGLGAPAPGFFMTWR